MIRILGRTTSINVRKVLWLADEMGLAYENEVWGKPLRDPKVPEFLALNPNAQVPVLVEPGFVLWESTAIIEYLASAYGPTPLLPDDARQLGLMRQWIGWQAYDLTVSWSYAFLGLIRDTPGYDDEAKIADSLERASAKMAILERALAGKSYILGETMSLADICLGLACHRWFSMPRDLPELPHARKYLERLRDRPAGATWLGADTP